MPRDVSTASHGTGISVASAVTSGRAADNGARALLVLPVPSDTCMPPSPPTQPAVKAVSDTELALSWQQGESQGSAPVLHFLVAYIRSVSPKLTSSIEPGKQV